MASSPKAAKEAKAETEGTIGPNWLELPRELTTNILQRLGTVEIVTSACRVCPLWWNICKDPFMWRTIHITNIRTSTYNMDNMDNLDNTDNLVNICCYAVERSCGQLEGIDIELFCTDNLLNCIANSSTCLRRIRLVKCQRFSPNVFNELEKKLPLLVEVDISFCYLPADSLEVIGRSCPLLKYLKRRKFHKMTWAFTSSNGDAFAIAKTMPKLRHLDILANFLTNVGLLAILDGCPLLESLDLRKCFFLDLSGSLGKRCRDQILDLQLPSPTDFVDDADDDDDDLRDDVEEDMRIVGRYARFRMLLFEILAYFLNFSSSLCKVSCSIFFYLCYDK